MDLGSRFGLCRPWEDKPFFSDMDGDSDVIVIALVHGRLGAGGVRANGFAGGWRDGVYSFTNPVRVSRIVTPAKVCLTLASTNNMAPAASCFLLRGWGIFVEFFSLITLGVCLRVKA